MIPFSLRRPLLMLRQVYTSRDRPDLARLERIEDPVAFVWAILPHAARTFSACIALLPARPALVAAVAYLYCRMLDTYEDLVADPAARSESLRLFAARLDDAVPPYSLPAAPPITNPLDRDDRDRAHLLLVRRAALVDRVFLSFDPSARHVIRELVQSMADGMRWSSATFEAGSGVLSGEEHVARYCRHVLGNPVVFSIRLMRLEHGEKTELEPQELEDAMRVGEMVQLANITRDVEKDLRRGIAYDESLREFLGRDASQGDREMEERCRAVRAKLLRMALSRAPAYAKVIDALHLPRWSVARASAVLMLLFTERYFRGCARRAGLPAWSGPSSTFALFLRTIPTTFSRRVALREVERIERVFLQATAFAANVRAYARTPT